MQTEIRKVKPRKCDGNVEDDPSVKKMVEARKIADRLHDRMVRDGLIDG